MKISVKCDHCKHDGITDLDFDIFTLTRKHDFAQGHCEYMWQAKNGMSRLHCMFCGSTNVVAKALDTVIDKRGVYGQLDLELGI